MAIRHFAHAATALATIVIAAGPALAGPPTEATKAANEAVLSELPFETDTKDFDWANRGFIANREDPLIRDDEGNVIFDLRASEMLEGDAPASANPSLWRASQLYAITGLFKAADNVYQVRGFDLANLTFVKGDTGWIVIDPLTSGETAKAAFELLTEHAGDFPITAMIYTHSHGDHYGGSRAIMDLADGDIPVIAPAGFLEEAISENVIAGPAMRRRATYHVGSPLGLDPEQRIGAGLGVGLAIGSYDLVPPTQLVSETGEELTVDGVRMVFQITSGTEAPAEFNIGFPELGVANIAENANPTHHNILTPRGAKVRDAKLWAESLTEAIDVFDYADVLVVSHGWPVFGKEEIKTYLSNQRDAYAFLHDQTVRMMNKGLTPEEIAAEIKLPDSIGKQWYNRPYYGDYTFNARAVYQFYLGFFDGVPAHLAPMPPAKAGQKYVEAMGGAGAVLTKAQAAYDAGDYQWASQLLNHLVFAGGDTADAEAMLADAYEQLGYQAESAIWRNFYLTGASELRDGVPDSSADFVDRARQAFAFLPTEDLFDVLATQVDPSKTGETPIRLGFTFPEREESVTVTVRNGVLIHEHKPHDGEYDAKLTIKRGDLLLGMLGETPIAQRIASGEASMEGNPMAFAKFARIFDRPTGDFPIVTP